MERTGADLGCDLRRELQERDGFLEFYGDYGEIAVMSNGKTIATWAEGFSWLGPGGTWFNIQS